MITIHVRDERKHLFPEFYEKKIDLKRVRGDDDAREFLAIKFKVNIFMFEILINYIKSIF